MSSLLLSPWTIKDVTLKNHVVMSPMCTHSADDDGHVTDFHRTHYTSRALGQVGLIFIESLAVERGGKIGDGDLGIWDDDHINGLSGLIDQLHSFGAKVGGQISHAGRNANGHDGNRVAPSAIPFDSRSQTPRELTVDEIKEIVGWFGQAARRCVAAGFDILEIHTAHGYLLNEFLSPLANTRTDAYGGSPENRFRIVDEIIDAVREHWTGPLFIRISSTDYAPGGNTPDSFVEYGALMKAKGIDLIDCSSGGIAPVSVDAYPNYQVPAAELLRRELGIPTGAVGLIRTGSQAEEILRNGRADLVFVGRQLLRDPFWVRAAADELGEYIDPPIQYTRYGSVWVDTPVPTAV